MSTKDIYINKLKALVGQTSVVDAISAIDKDAVLFECAERYLNKKGLSVLLESEDNDSDVSDKFHSKNC